MKPFIISLAFFFSLVSSAQDTPVPYETIKSPFGIDDLFRFCSMSNQEFRQLAADKGFAYIISENVRRQEEVHYYDFMLMGIILMHQYPLDNGVVLMLRNLTSDKYQEFIDNLESLGYFMYSREYDNGYVLLTYEKQNSPFSILTAFSSNELVVKNGGNLPNEILHLNSLAIDVRKR